MLINNFIYLINKIIINFMSESFLNQIYLLLIIFILFDSNIILNDLKELKIKYDSLEHYLKISNLILTEIKLVNDKIKKHIKSNSFTTIQENKRKLGESLKRSNSEIIYSKTNIS